MRFSTKVLRCNFSDPITFNFVAYSTASGTPSIPSVGTFLGLRDFIFHEGINPMFVKAHQYKPTALIQNISTYLRD